MVSFIQKSLVVLFIFIGSVQAFAQCKMLAKKQCFPSLSPYIQNGQLNSAKLSAGESAEMQLSFYSGQNYRLMVCAEGVLGDVNFKVFDADKKELYTSNKGDKIKTEKTDGPKYWDFNVANTQQLIVEVLVPPSDAPNKLIPDGCVSIIVGFQQQKK